MISRTATRRVKPTLIDPLFRTTSKRVTSAVSNSNWPQTSEAILLDGGEPSRGPDLHKSKWVEKLRDGTTVLIRPITDEDVTLERRFIEGLSPQSSRFRFLGE